MGGVGVPHEQEPDPKSQSTAGNLLMDNVFRGWGISMAQGSSDSGMSSSVAAAPRPPSVCCSACISEQTAIGPEAWNPRWVYATALFYPADGHKRPLWGQHANGRYWPTALAGERALSHPKAVHQKTSRSAPRLRRLSESEYAVIFELANDLRRNLGDPRVLRIN